MSNNLTERQQQVLDFIAEFIRREGVPPVYRDISEHFGWAGPASVVCHLYALEKKGFLKRYKGLSRGLTLTQQGNACPYCGQGMS